jgi:hypothetical protein
MGGNYEKYGGKHVQGNEKNPFSFIFWMAKILLGAVAIKNKK